MLKTRVIPVLLWDGKQAVQSVHFKRPHRPVGSMMQLVENFERRQIDELIILDVEATKERREPLYEEIKEYTSKLFCPLTVGGGVVDLKTIENLLLAGADKVAINTALLENSDFIYEAARKFGSQCIVASINNIYDHGVNIICSSDGTQTQVVPTRHVCKFAEELGAGEILLTDVYANGTLKGYNTDLIAECSNYVSIPVIANGGCGTLQHVEDALHVGASAIAASSMFLFRDITPKDVSRHLHKKGFPARIDTPVPLTPEEIIDNWELLRRIKITPKRREFFLKLLRESDGQIN